jgi:CRISPR-associated protein Csx17
MAGHVLELRGCTPEPLGNYLKGLGVFRLLAEQADPQVRAWWRDGVLWLLTKWSLDEVVDFFVQGIGDEKKPIYRPTPIFAPWGGRPGFYEDGNKKAKERLAKLRALSQAGRFSASQQTVRTTDEILASHEWTGLNKKKRAELKPDIVAAMRNAWGCSAVDWFDACLSLEEDARFGFLYGTGGNERSADITNNFWELIDEVIGLPDPETGTRESLISALFAKPRVGGTAKTAGQNFPLAAGSSNCGQEFVGSSSTNPWDVVLMMEGAVLFAGATTKRLSQQGKGKAAFPFMIDHLATDELSTSSKDEAKQDGKVVRCRAEFWMPLWHSPVSLPGMRALLSEGRLQRQSGENSEHTLHAMEAIKTLGVSRGVDTFHRVALFERRGKGYYLASSLGFHTASRSSESYASQLAEIDFFRQQIYRHLREGPGIPDRIIRARHRFHASLAVLLERDEHGVVGASDALLEVVAGASAVEREVALLKDRAQLLTPCPALTPSWLGSGRCGSDYRLAHAVAAIAPWGESLSNDQPRPAVESMRANLLPVARKGRSWVWDETTRSAVWARGASLESNLVAVLRRRLIDARRGVGDGLPLWSFYGAGFEDILALWRGQVDEQRLADLIRALSLIDAGPWNEAAIEKRQRDEPTPDLQTGAVWFGLDEQAHIHFRPVEINEKELRAALELPRVYHMLKLCFVGGRLPRRPMPDRTAARSGDEPFPPACLEVLTLLEAGRLSEAAQISARRLRAKGYPAVLRDADLQFLEEMKTALNANKQRPVHIWKMVPAIFERDPGCVLHGVFLDDIDGRVRLPRLVSAYHCCPGHEFSIPAKAQIP